MRHKRLALLALYAGSALVATSPALNDVGSAFIADESEARPGYEEASAGDHLQSVYRFWLVGHQLERLASPWLDPYSFQPVAEPQLTLGGWPFGLAFWPLDALGGPVLAWNMLLLACITLGGLAACAWLEALGLARLPAAIGGLAFAIAPYRLVQSGGHLLGWIAVFLPLSLWAFERARAAATWQRHAFGLLAALALVSVPLSGQLHLALGAIPLFFAYSLIRFDRVATGWMAGGVIAAAAIGVVIDRLVIAGSVASQGRSLAELHYYSADWVDLVSRWRLRGVEQYVYVGWLTPILALCGLVLLARGQRRLALVLGLAGVLPLLLALGTNLPLYEPLRDVLPPLRYPRVPSRFVSLSVLALAALAAFAVSALLARVSLGRRRVVGATMLVLVAADLLVFPLRASEADPGNAAYAHLRTEPPGRLLEIPIVGGVLGQYGSVYQYYVMQAPRERPSGYSSLAPRASLSVRESLRHLNCGDWHPQDSQRLEELGVRYILVHIGVFRQAGLDGAWFAWQALQAAGYRLLAQGGSVWLLGKRTGPPEAAPVPEPDRRQPVLCQGWHAGKTTEATSLLWLWGSGETTLRIEAAVPTSLTVDVDGGEGRSHSVARSSEISFPLVGERWHLIRLQAETTGLALGDIRRGGKRVPRNRIG